MVATTLRPYHALGLRNIPKPLEICWVGLLGLLGVHEGIDTAHDGFRKTQTSPKTAQTIATETGRLSKT
eukprot:1088119-Pyramimonas_sp.AAC.1